jgi:4-hydroxybenzoate polyprenyltransferase
MFSIREVRGHQWWFSKVAPALAVSYCAALVYRVSAADTARAILLIAFVGLCAGSYGHIVNDIFDIEIDRRAGKQNRMAGFARWQRFLFCAVTLVMGFAPAALLSCSRTSLALLAVEYLLPTLYSVPPFRLKESGTLGVLCDAMGAHLVPSLYVISLLAHHAADPALLRTRTGVAFLCTVAAWALCLGLIGIIIHEYQDRANDLQSGIRTFATGLLFSRLRRLLSQFYAVEICAFVGLAVTLLTAAPLVAASAILFALTLVVKVARHWIFYRRTHEEATMIQWWQLTHPYYEFYFPLAAALQCAWLHPGLAPLPLLQVALFAPTLYAQLPELQALPGAAFQLFRASIQRCTHMQR